MSLSPVELKIRPLAESRFIQGYPGISPSGPRSLATIDGEVVVKVNQRGLRGKYLRVGLVQVEMVPKGSGIENFYDSVVPGPIILWESGKRSKRLQENLSVFTFSLRIPEALPPSVLFSNQEAGIRYKICAKLYTKTKGKSFSDKATSNIYRTEEPIVIDKHEMHSTWPVYSRYRMRTATDQGCTLAVTSSRSCYGPGDRLCVGATLRVGELEEQGILLRGFELSLDESAELRSGHTSKPETKSSTVCLAKLQINRPVRSSSPQKVDLACFIPADRVTVSLCSRHIKVEHTITVKAIFEDLPPLVVSLPVVVTNWPRSLSLRATKRIGAVPNLSGAAPTRMTSSRSTAFSGDLSPIRLRSLAHGTSTESMLTTVESGDTSTSYYQSGSSSTGHGSSEEESVAVSSVRGSRLVTQGPRRSASDSSFSNRAARRRPPLVPVSPIEEASPQIPSQQPGPSFNNKKSRHSSKISEEVVPPTAEHSNAPDEPSSSSAPPLVSIPISKSAEELSSPVGELPVPQPLKRFSVSDPGHGASRLDSRLFTHKEEIVQPHQNVQPEVKKHELVRPLPPPYRKDDDVRPISYNGTPSTPIKPALVHRATTLRPHPPSSHNPRQSTSKLVLEHPTPIPFAQSHNYEFLQQDPSESPSGAGRSSSLESPQANKPRPLPKLNIRSSLATVVSDDSSIYRNTLAAIPSPLDTKPSSSAHRLRRPLPTPPDTPPAVDRVLSAEEEKAMIHKQVDRWHSRQRPESGNVRPPPSRPMTPRHRDANNWDEDVVTLAGPGDETGFPR